MGIVQFLLLGTGLSMDAFAVSVCKGLKMKKIDKKYTFLIAFFFGVFQALMPVIGWILGRQFEQYITSVDHWIAFILLFLIGGNMIGESFKQEEDNRSLSFDLRELFLLAIATSIDALAVGITFAFLKVKILPAITCIGTITFFFSIGGVIVGNQFGIRYKNKAELAGGVILILIGSKILLEHLGILG